VLSVVIEFGYIEFDCNSYYIEEFVAGTADIDRYCYNSSGFRTGTIDSGTDC